MSSLKAAVVGCGGHAQLHLRMIDKEPRLHLVGVAEIDATRREQAQAEWRVEGFADYRRMLDACKPDLVVVATMPGHLKAIVIDCLERGVHTSVEKAPGMHVDETRAMAAAAAKSAGKAIVSFNRRYFPEVLALRRMVEARGGAVHCAATYNKPLSPPMGTSAWHGVAPDSIICDASTMSTFCVGWPEAARVRRCRSRCTPRFTMVRARGRTATARWCVLTLALAGCS